MPRTTFRAWEEHLAQCIEDGYPLIVGPPSEGWYRDGDGRMCYLWTSDFPLEPIRSRFSGYEMTDCGLQIFVPSPQDQPGIPQKNDWLKGRRWAKGDVWSL